MSKLSDEQAKAAIGLVADFGIAPRFIADRLGVSQHAVRDVVRGRTHRQLARTFQPHPGLCGAEQTRAIDRQLAMVSAVRRREEAMGLRAPVELDP